MPISSVVKNFRDGTLTLEDATVGALTVQYENGDFSAEGFNQGEYEVVAYLDRGEMGSLRKTSRKFPTFTFTAQLTDVSDATNKNLIDIVRKAGAYAAGTSQSGASADVWTLKVTLTIEGTNYGDASDHTVVLQECFCEIAFAEGDPDTFTLTGTCYGSRTFT
jgi:hypothetical protein